MTIQEAIVAALDEWSKDPEFDIADKMAWVEEEAMGTIEKWAAENGWTFNEELYEWEKQ